MEISIQTSGLHLAHGTAQRLRRYIRQCIEGRFSWITQRITHVAVYLGDSNGPRGGHDKSGVVKVSLNGLPATLARGSGRDPFALVDRLSVCAAQDVARRVKRRPGTASLRKMAHTGD